MTSKKYTDEELLAELRHLAAEDEAPTQKEMRERGAHSPTTYQRRFGSWSTALEAAGFETKRPGVIRDGAILSDEDELERLYWDEEMSVREIAEEAECCGKTVHNRLNEFGIKTRTSTVDMPPRFTHTDEDVVGLAYEIWRTYSDETYHRVRVHRLVAVAEHGFQAVAGSVVHHKNSIPWDNRASNLEVMTHEEHATKHAQERLDNHGVAIVGGDSHGT